MAIQDKSLASSEHDWYATRSTATINAPLNQHKLEYWASKGCKTEQEWLQNMTSSSSITLYELWSRACDSQTIAVGQSVDECRFNFYTGVASGTNP